MRAVDILRRGRPNWQEPSGKGVLLSEPLTGVLPRRVVVLVSVVEDLEVAPPDDVLRIAEKLRDCAEHETPKTRLNNVFGQLKRRNPGAIEILLKWLQSSAPDAQFRGLADARRLWIDACTRLLRGEKATHALGVNVSGRPRSPGFTATHDAALLASGFQRFGGLSETKAIAQAAEITDSGDADSAPMDTKRIRAQLRRLAQVPDQDIQQQCLALKEKYPDSNAFEPLLSRFSEFPPILKVRRPAD
jgi:hypothetical protein